MSDTTQTENIATEETPETTDELRTDIEETRASMTRTIDAIQEKLDPERVKEQMMEKLHDATVGRAQILAQTANEKLTPVAEKAEKLGDNLRESGLSAAKDANKWARRNPLIAGGAALGALLMLGVGAFLTRRS